MIELQKELENIKNDVDIKLGKLADINQRIKEQEDNLSYVSDKIDKRLGDVLEKDKFLAFFQKPYVIIPQNKEKVLVAVPKFIKNFQVGWLWKETDNYYIYQLDQYSAWLGDVPTDLLQEIDLKKVFNEVYVEGNVIKFSQADKEAVKQKLKYHIKDIGEGEASITRGHTFDVIAEIIKSGCLPFKPRMVSKDDLRTPKGEIKLRPYQNEAYQKFLNTGAVGVFHPTGAGKSFISLYAIDCLKGRKVIITPTTTLTEQWKYYIEKFIPHAKDEIDIVTYQGFRKYDEEYSLVIFDECQRLPANTFSRLAVIKAKYRLGLSASPHREDGRENYIFALTGFPVGLNWKDYMETVGKSYHPIKIHVVKSKAQKMRKLYELLDMKKKTLIFCDTIALGKQVAKEYSIPYIYGETKNRLDEIENNKVVAVSRVADLGISIKDLQRIIEVDFLFGSRQQELQRTGRLMHSEKAERHDIIMTEAEFNQYGKRLWALQEKGFSLKIEGN